MEWVGDCDFVLVDLSDCISNEKDRALETVRGLAKVLKKETTLFFVLDYIPVFEFFGIERRMVWDDEITLLKRTNRMYIVDSEQKKSMKEREEERWTSLIDFFIFLIGFMTKV